MKRVLAIIGSPRRLGNCEILAKEISRHVPEAHELRLLRLSDFDIQACRGCYACLFGDGGCIIPDDYGVVAEELLRADAYIVAVPTYFLGPASVLKRLTDRGLALFPRVEELWGRPAVAVVTAGKEGLEGYAALGVESFLKFVMADIQGLRVLYGALPGEIFDDPDNREAARELAAALFGGGREEESPACPVCSGRTFRFYGAGRVRCMLCSNSGTVSLEDGTLRFEIGTEENEMFVSSEAAVAHREWLKSMKHRFLSERGRLKEITGAYRDEGAWVKP